MRHPIYFQYGGVDEHGNWNGMIKEVLDGPEVGGADFAVADLSITTARSSAVQFSMPWLNLGKSLQNICSSACGVKKTAFLFTLSRDVANICQCQRQRQNAFSAANNLDVHVLRHRDHVREAPPGSSQPPLVPLSVHCGGVDLHSY